MPQVARGLEGVVAGTTALSFIDGRAGRLLYRGYDIRDLAQNATFEEVCFLLWYGRLPTRSELAALRDELATLRTLPPPLWSAVRSPEAWEWVPWTTLIGCAVVGIWIVRRIT